MEGSRQWGERKPIRLHLRLPGKDSFLAGRKARRYAPRSVARSTLLHAIMQKYPRGWAMPERLQVRNFRLRTPLRLKPQVVPLKQLTWHSPETTGSAAGFFRSPC